MQQKPKYLRIASDLHLEAFGGDAANLQAGTLPPDPRDKESVLILAGDISSATNQLRAFLEHLSPQFGHICVVPGNHEYYGHEYNEKNIALSAMNFANVTHSSGDVICTEFEGVRIIYGTLWADGGNSLAEMGRVGHYMNDFNYIRFKQRLFTVPDMKTLNAIHRNVLEKFLKKPFDGRTIVATHHMPSYQLCHPRFGTDCNGGFASHCDRLFYEDFAPSVWIHGHTHDTIDTVMGSTRIICNPAGYLGEWGNSHNYYIGQGPKFIEL